MQQAVLAECVYRTVAAIPLMVLTRAHRTADRGRVTSLTVFQVWGVKPISTVPVVWKAFNEMYMEDTTMCFTKELMLWCL